MCLEAVQCCFETVHASDDRGACPEADARARMHEVCWRGLAEAWWITGLGVGTLCAQECELPGLLMEWPNRVA